MQKNCLTCKKDFEIRKEDLIFYEQVKVPPPLYCPDCRMQRRLAFRNERTLYKRPCDLCKKDIISLYPSGTLFPVYCQTCWWGDGWDPTIYGIEYNKDKTFLQQCEELKNKVPRIALVMLNSTNSDYTNGAAENKNCYLVFAAENNEDCLYGSLVQRCKNLMDCKHLPPKIFDRTCAKCKKDIQTAYSPDRKEIVYCETCYQQEVY